MLDQPIRITAALVPLADRDGITLACDEYILVLLDRDTILGEHGNVAVVS